MVDTVQAQTHRKGLISQGELISREQSILRTELTSLKNCQITFLTYAVTGTALLLGLAVNLGGSATAPFPLNGVFYLLPLTILLPFWWVFFDKASTITRIVGYYRILEEVAVNPDRSMRFLGWENALAKYRERYGKALPPEAFPKLSVGQKIDRIVQLFILQTTQRYWILTYYTFLSLSLLSLSIAIISLYTVISQAEILITMAVLTVTFITGLQTGQRARIGAIACLVIASIIFIYFWRITPPTRASVILIIVAAMIVGISISRNLIIVMRLSWGEYSYRVNHLLWREILNVQ